MTAAYRERMAQQEALEQRAKRETCSCGRSLVVAYHEGVFKLRCGACGYNPATRVIPSQSPRARFRRGEPLDALDCQTLERQLVREIRLAESEAKEPPARTVRLLNQLRDYMVQGRSLTKTHQDIVAADEAARFVDLGKLYDGSKVTRDMAIQYIQRTGLNPLANEVCVYEGKLFPTVDGLRHLALRSGLFDGAEAPVFLSDDEKRTEGYLPDELVCRIKVYRKGMRLPVVGTGKANRDAPYRGNPVEKLHPTRMAENRAWRHAFRQGFQDLMSDGLIELPPDEIDEGQRYVDRTTGEIIDGSIVEPQDGEFATDDTQVPPGWDETAGVAPAQPEEASDESPAFELAPEDAAVGQARQAATREELTAAWAALPEALRKQPDVRRAFAERGEQIDTAAKA